MELYQRPFKTLFIDTIGPFNPESDGCRYIFHAECPFSRYCWLKASASDTEEAWAKFLMEEVFLDVCGFPVFLRSDRGSAFTSKLVEEMNRLLQITHRFGSAYHPQAQGYIEARHKPVQSILRAYVASVPENWAKCVKFAQWALRCVPREDGMGRSPYEIVTFPV